MLANNYKIPSLGISAGLGDIRKICDDKLSGNRYQNISHVSVGFRPHEVGSIELGILLRAAGMSVSLHPVDLNISDVIEVNDLDNIKQLVDQLEPLYLEEDLGVWRHRELFLESHLLNPVMSQAAIELTIDNVRKCKSFLNIPIAIENPPVYWVEGEIDFWEYFVSIATQADCLIAFDVGHFIGYCRSLDKKVYFHQEQSIVWDKIITIHLSGMKSWNWNGIPVWIDRHSETFNQQIQAVTAFCLKKTRSLHNLLMEMEGASIEVENKNIDSIFKILNQ